MRTPSYLGKLPNGLEDGPSPLLEQAMVADAACQLGLGHRWLECSLPLNVEGMTEEQLQTVPGGHVEVPSPLLKAKVSSTISISMFAFHHLVPPSSHSLHNLISSGLKHC